MDDDVNEDGVEDEDFGDAFDKEVVEDVVTTTIGELEAECSS
jgi:hypothetical protein